MATPRESNIVSDTPVPGVRVVRFVRPDVRDSLYDQEEITASTLYRELDRAALANLHAGETVIINFGLVDHCPTAVYRLLLAVRKAVQDRNARLLLCCFTPFVRECFDLCGGGKLFDIRATEANAIFEAGKPKEQAR